MASLDWKTLGSSAPAASGETLEVHSPIDGASLATFKMANAADVERAIDAASEAFLKWRIVPGPKRGEFVRRIGDRLRARKRELANVVCHETGKIMAEALGEVQEMIDICDFAVG